MILITAVDMNWSIGYKGRMLFEIREDLARFKRLTQENIVIMGRKTFESLPNSKALPNRINVVMTTDVNYKADNIIVVNSIDDLFKLLRKINPQCKMKTFIIGGGNIVRQLIIYCNKAYITKAESRFVADVAIPDLDKDENWKIISESNTYMQGDLAYRYVNYINDANKAWNSDN